MSSEIDIAESHEPVHKSWSHSRGAASLLILLCAWATWNWLLSNGHSRGNVGIMGAPNYKVDINTATQAEWRALPDIGEELAKRIVSYRHRVGRFESIEELMEVRGFGEKTLANLRTMLACELKSQVDDEHQIVQPSKLVWNAGPSIQFEEAENSDPSDLGQ